MPGHLSSRIPLQLHQMQRLLPTLLPTNQDDFNPDDRPNIYAEQKYLALRQLIAKLFCIPATPRPLVWNVCFHRAVSSCGYIVQR